MDITKLKEVKIIYGISVLKKEECIASTIAKCTKTITDVSIVINGMNNMGQNVNDIPILLFQLRYQSRK